MPNLHHHFRALLSNVNPSERRLRLASTVLSDVRTWLKEHDFQTETPHSRLSGSYARDTAICEIKDVDVLLFVPEASLERTPNAVLLELRAVLGEYPDALAEASGQRRSVHLQFPQHGFHLDIVPAVVEQGLDRPLRVPDRPSQNWILSDPLGYADRLSGLNQDHGEKVKPLIKLVKAWRDVQMKVRRPKSYALEVMVLYAVESGAIELRDRSTADNLADFFAYVVEKYRDLMDNGTESPRIPDPQVSGTYITRGWERTHFETFMRRAREADRAAQRAVDAETVEAAAAEWATLFGDLWPTADAVRCAARAEATAIMPGRAAIGRTGLVIGSSTARSIPTVATTYHGDGQ